MRVLQVKLLRELSHSRWLLLTITSIVAIGITCYVSMQSAWLNLTTARARYYEQCRMADFWIDLKKAPTSELNVVSRLPGVTEIQPRIQFNATVDLGYSVEPINGLVVSLPTDPAHRRVNKIVMRQGGGFTDRRQNEVIVNDKFARHHRLYPGQWIHVLLNNRRQPLFVVGTAVSSEFAYLLGPGAILPDPERFGVFYIKHDYAEEVFDFAGAANQVIGRISPSMKPSTHEILRQAESKLDEFGVFSTTPLKRQASNQFLTGEIDGLGGFAAVVPPIFLAVAALVLNVLVTRLARQQRTVVGTLKALGYTDGQIFRHFLWFGVSVGILGGVIGCALGYLSATGMTVVYRIYFEFPDLRSELHWHTYAVGMSVSLACAIAGSFFGARSMLRLQPSEAMRPEPPRHGRRIWLERLPTFWNGLSAAWRVALRNLFRHRFRTAAGVFAAAMGASLLVTGFMMVEAQNFMIDFQFYRVSRSDIDLTFNAERGPEVLNELRDLPAVDHVEPLFQLACTFEHGRFERKGAVSGLRSDARLTVPRDSRGEPIPLPASGIVMTRPLAEVLNIRRGDTISLTPVKGERRPLRVRVVRIADTFIGMAAYAEIGFLSRLVGEELAISSAQLATDLDPDRMALLYGRLKEMPGVESIHSRREMIAGLQETLQTNLFVFIFVLIGFAGAVFFGSIVNASIVNLAERMREVATLQALGYGQWQIGWMFLRESMLTTIVGTLVGCPLGYGLMHLAAASYKNDLLRLPVVHAPWIWLATFVLAIVFGVLAHGVVQRTIHCMNYLEALKVKE